MSFFPALVSLLAGGLFLTLFRVPYWEIGSRFYKLITYMSLIGWTLILLMLDPVTISEWLFFGLISVLAVMGLAHIWMIKSSREQIRRACYWTGIVLILWQYLALALWPPGYQSLDYHSPVWILFLQFTLSAGILGAVLNAMICGHWYLVNQYLSLKPIQTITRTLGNLLVAKGLLLGGIFIYFYLTNFAPLEKVLLYFPVLISVRVLAGIFFGWGLNWMAIQTLEYDNTQAATGILYACITFIFMGEFSAYYLTVHSGIGL